MQNNPETSAPEELVLLRLVRGEPLAGVLASCRADGLSLLALEHMVISPLAYRVEAEAGVSPAWRRWAASIIVGSERDGRLCASAMEKTIGLLESAGIPPVVIKGASLALGKPRDAGDVDLLIPGDSLIKAISLLEAAGYAYRGYERNMHIHRGEYRDWDSLARWSNQFEFAEPATGALIELHTAFFETERVYAEDLSALRASIGEFIESSVVDTDTGYRFLSLEDRCLLLAMHAGLKRSPANKEFVARHLLDLRTLIDTGLDWERLETRAFRFGAAHHLALLLRLYESLAGQCCPPLYVDGIESKLPPRILWLLRLHRRCLHGLVSYDRLAIFAYSLVSPFMLRGTPRARLRSILVFPLLFPPRYSLARIYGLPPRSRLTFLCYLLEPARLLYRLARKATRALSPL
jgi:hypothetical protein